jgi:hypothetical protein
MAPALSCRSPAALLLERAGPPLAELPAALMAGVMAAEVPVPG